MSMGAHTHIGFELVDMSNHLPGLVFRPGIKTWTPSVDRSVDLSFQTFQDYIQSLPENKRADSKLVESHWPPTPEEAEELRLNLWSVYCSDALSHVD